MVYMASRGDRCQYFREVDEGGGIRTPKFLLNLEEWHRDPDPDYVERRIKQLHKCQVLNIHSLDRTFPRIFENV